MRLALATLLATLAGYVALSYEILWVRAYSFLGAGVAYLFGVFLGSYLFGLALGALRARRSCEGADTSQLATLSYYLLAASVAGFVLVPALAWVTPPLYGALPSRIAFAVLQIPLACAAGLFGITLPLVAHFGVPPDERAGERVALLYLGNIFGSAAGSLLTGYVLLDAWPLATCARFLALVGLGMTGLTVALAGFPRAARARFAAALAAAAVLVAFLGPRLYDPVWARFLFKDEYVAGRALKSVVENKSGVICIDADDRIYGGGSYDGAFSVDPVDDINGITRAYGLAAIAAPKDVLMVGLGSGAWAQVVVNQPGVEHLTVIEINPGYLDVIAGYPVVAGLLDDPRVTIVIDDGRRWLKRTDRRFDAIVQNTTQHWRGHVTNLVSVEYLELVRAHLNEGGVFYYNTTESEEVQRTGATVFRHAVLLRTFLAVSDAPLTPDRARWSRALRAWSYDGRAAVAPGDIAIVMDRWPFEDRASILARTEGATIITDDNMASEW